MHFGNTGHTLHQDALFQLKVSQKLIEFWLEYLQLAFQVTRNYIEIGIFRLKNINSVKAMKNNSHPLLRAKLFVRSHYFKKIYLEFSILKKVF